MRRLLAATGTLSAICLLLAPALSSAAILEAGFERETVASGFVLPVAMAFTPDGRIFVAQKGGSVRIVQDGVVLPDPLITLTDVNTFGDRGLIGMAVDPDFASNGYLYLSYTYENTPGAAFGGPKTARIVRVTVVGNVALESSKVVLVGTVGGGVGAPSCENFAITADCIPSDSSSHSAGGLRFGPDGKLYATLGDGANFDYADPLSLRAQNIDSLAGKVLRINTDGSAPSDNPFYNGDPSANRSKVYAYGIRNAFRLNFNPFSGALYVGDVGWSSTEEVNRIVSGGNYGWPCWEGAQLTTHDCAAANTAATYAYPHNEFGAGSVTVGSFGFNEAYPAAYDRNLFVGDYAQNWIRRLVLDADDNLVSVHEFMDDPDGPVDISTGPDGTVYFLSIYTGELHRITHTTGNRRPVVQISATPTSGLAPLMVNFSSTGTMDPDGNPITLDWSFGDGSSSSATSPVHTYTTNGTYPATLTVTDSLGSSASKNITITVGNQAPTATINAPLSGELYLPGEVISLEGAGIDSEDGTLPASAFSWRIILHHNTHIHIEQEFIGTKHPWFIAPDHNSSDVYTEIELTVTDSGGLTHTTSVNMYLDNSLNGGNLIPNPSVETPEDGGSGNPLYWIRGFYGLNNATFTYPTAGLAGSKAMSVSMDYHVDGSAKWYFSPISVSPGEQFLYSNYYTADVPTSLFAQFTKGDGSYQYLDLGVVPAAATPTQVSRTITIPADTENMTVWHQLEAVGELRTDDFSLVEIVDPTDTTAPAIYLSSPIDGSTVSGTLSVTAQAADQGGVASVAFLIDGMQHGAEDATEPYQFSWNSTSVPNGAHTLSARVRDLAGNTTTSSIQITVGNASPNMVVNGDFEIADGAAPFNWGEGGWGNHVRTYTYPIAGENGGRAARVDITSYPPTPVGDGDSKWFFTKVPVVPGTEYTYSDRYRSNTISDIIGQYTLSDGSYHYFGLAKEIQPTATWQTVTGTFVPPIDATHVTFFHLISAVGFLELDDVVMYESGSGPPSETNAPIVEITNPLANQTVSDIVNITASSTDDTAVTYVFYAIDGVPVTGQITEAPYLFAWDTSTVSDGPHLIKVTTHDPYGNNATHTITVTVDNTSPTANNLIANPSLEVPGTPGNPQGWLRGGWGTNDRTFTYPTAGSHGTDAAKVEITSYTNGDAKWYFAEVPVTPGITYEGAHDYKSTVPTEVLVRYTLEGGAVQYQFISSQPASETWASTAYTITPPADTVSLTLFHILHSVGALEVDAFSLSTSDAVAPSVTLTAPGAGAVSGSVTVSGTATDNVGVAGVTLLVNGVVSGAEDTSAPYEFVWDTTSLANGAYSLALRARDAAGNTATSGTASVTVNNTTVPLTSLIANPSLETAGVGGDPEGWLRGGWGTNTRTFTYPVAGSHGQDGARVEISSYTSGDAKWYFAEVPVTSGRTYDLTYDYRSDVGTEVLARITHSNGSYSYQYLGSPAVSDAWAPLQYAITVPADATHLTVFHVIHSVGFLETDRFVLIDRTPPPDTLQSIIFNPSVEVAAEGGDPENWFRSRWGTNATTFTYPVAGSHGEKAMRIEMTSYTDGDAKWRHADVAVTPGAVYTLSHAYRANVLTNITVRYTLANGTFQYVSLGNYPAATGWTTLTNTFVVPAQAQSMTVMHILNQVGWLETDAYALISGNANQFDDGMVSLTFDDGWISHYTNALPVLDAANVKGTFYIVSLETLNAVPIELVHNPSLEIIDYADEGYPERWHPGGWGTNDRVFTYPIDGETGSGAKVEITSYESGDAKWWFEPVAVIPGQTYRFEDSYLSTATTEVILEITKTDDTIQYMYLAALPSTEGTWQRFSIDADLPDDARLVTMYHILGTVGSLTIDNMSVKRVQTFVDVPQMLAMQAAGHEIGGHTRTHANLALIPDAEADTELSVSRTELLNAGVAEVTNMAYPFGAYDADVQQMTQAAGFTAARGVERGYNTRATDKYALKIQSMNRTTTLAEVQGWIAQAQADNTWLILMFHQIDEDPEATLGISPAFLQQTVDAIVSSGIEVVSVKEGVSRMNP